MKKILAIETSCDETAIALLQTNQIVFGQLEQYEIEVLGEATRSQIDTHAPYGGVFPTLAKREHAQYIVALTDEVFRQTKITYESHAPIDEYTKNYISHSCQKNENLLSPAMEFLSREQKPIIDYIVVTVGPGLAPALWVGVMWAKMLSQRYQIPIIPANHMIGHLYAALLSDTNSENKFSLTIPTEKFITLLVSGGHTEIILTDIQKNMHKKIGHTLDDAAGEAYDKVARMLALPYPGGPQISRLANTAREKFLSPVQFPRPLYNDSTFNFSFSGLKTAVQYYLRDTYSKSTPIPFEDTLRIALGFEDALIDCLIHKTEKAIITHSPSALACGGGVSANTTLRERLHHLAKKHTIPLHIPKIVHSTDNAIMIALTAVVGNPEPVSLENISAIPSVSL
ncbi:MAG: tRNA (adenosine(37)-N6)-threonylcarbamoyltransferase complex transferase subunit TsaD [Alphaproteobacteria bacterium]|nr:tRNA (adenosine(37)-N6)-threonylcarbamoyltransferase complex transferase subunit TsaD [Alphaproteobacteria bacterium]